MPNWYVEAVGPQTATIDTEHSLVTATKPGRYRFSVDVRNLTTNPTPAPAEAEIVEIRFKRKLDSADAAVQMWPTFSFVSGLLVQSIAEWEFVVAGDQSVEVTLKQITPGTGRTFDWELLREVSGIEGTVTADAGDSTTTFKSSLTGYGTDAFKDMYVHVLSGNNAGLSRYISAYNTTTGFITVTVGFPSDVWVTGDKIVIVST